MYKIVIVTSGQPSANPRVVKEATALSDSGYNVTVVYAPLSPWADGFDEELFAATPSINWVCVGAHPIKNAGKYKFIRARRKIYEVLFKKAPFLVFANENAVVLYAQELRKIASAIKADIYIAHNLGALPAAVAAAKKWKVCCGFDAEDYHSGEEASDSLQFKLSIKIENINIPQLDYLSAASPLIAEAYKKRFSNQRVFTINNVFGKQHLQPVSLGDKKNLSLFWFSQTVGTNRGLELVVDALNLVAEPDISLHILGSCNDSYRNELLSRAKNADAIHFLPPSSLREIFTIASKFDIGLASEVPYCVNRNICLTNKLFTYLLASNCILASDTASQQRFFKEYPGIGLIYKHDDATDLASQIARLYEDRALLLQCKQNAHGLANSKLNWEKESEIFLQNISATLAKH